LLRVATEEPRPPQELNPELPPPLATLITRLLAKKPADRPPSADRVAETCRDLERQRAQADRPSRRRWLWLTGGALAATAGGIAWLLGKGSSPEPPAPGTVIFEIGEASLRVELRRGGQPQTVLDLRHRSQHTLPAGDYTLRALEVGERRKLLPDHLTITPGQTQTVRLRLVGEVRRFSGHTGPVWAVALSPRGGLLALSASSDRTVAVWDATRAPTEKNPPRRLTGHTSAVLCIAFSPDGRLALSGSGERGQQPDMTARLWDLNDRKEVKRLEGFEHWVTAVTFLPGGRKALIGCADGTAQVWDLANREPLFALQGHEESVNGVACSADGRHLLTGGSDNRVILWDGRTGKLQKTLKGHKKDVKAVVLWPDGLRAASASRDGSIRIWDLKTGASTVLTGHRDDVLGLALAPDGQRLLSGGQDGTVRLWDVKTRKETYRLEGHKGAVTSVAYAADGRHALSGGMDGTVRLWELPE
jgi:WD40 repeat protein